jgi:hypothetical protein
VGVSETACSSEDENLAAAGDELAVTEVVKVGGACWLGDVELSGPSVPASLEPEPVTISGTPVAFAVGTFTGIRVTVA